MYGKTLDDFPERLDEFLDEFKGSDPVHLDKAFKVARAKHSEFPTPADIRSIYNSLATAPSFTETQRLLKRGDKPPDWNQLGNRNGIAPEQIQEWLEAGKEAQREHIAKLHEDPEWRAMAKKLGAHV